MTNSVFKCRSLCVVVYIDKYLSFSDNVVNFVFWIELATLAAMTQQNITLDPKVYDEFCKYASRYGIKLHHGFIKK